MNLMIVMAAFVLYGQKIDNGYVIESTPKSTPFATLKECTAAGSAYKWDFPADYILLGHAYYYRLVCLDHEQPLAKDVPANPRLYLPN